MVLRSIRTGVLICLILALSAMVILISHVNSGRGTSLPWFYETSQVSASNHSPARPVTNKEILGTTKHTPDTSISVFVRMSGKRPDHRQRYLCNVFRTSVLFWPPSFGNLVVGLDEESQEDHEFAEKLKTLAQKYFPDRRLEFFYEALPKDKGTLEFQGSPKTPGYNRQLWSSFFIDLLSNDTVIAWMDSDSAFFTPVTKSTIFNGTKVRALGSACTFYRSWVYKWADTTKQALGLPFVADFMTYFRYICTETRSLTAESIS